MGNNCINRDKQNQENLAKEKFKLKKKFEKQDLSIIKEEKSIDNSSKYYFLLDFQIFLKIEKDYFSYKKLLQKKYDSEIKNEKFIFLKKKLHIDNKYLTKYKINIFKNQQLYNLKTFFLSFNNIFNYNDLEIINSFNLDEKYYFEIIKYSEKKGVNILKLVITHLKTENEIIQLSQSLNLINEKEYYNNIIKKYNKINKEIILNIKKFKNNLNYFSYSEFNVSLENNKINKSEIFWNNKISEINKNLVETSIKQNENILLLSNFSKIYEDKNKFLSSNNFNNEQFKQKKSLFFN